MAKESKKVKFTGRERRKLRLRKKIRGTDEKPRVCAFRSGKHIYAQVVSDADGKIIASASTREKSILDKLQGDKVSTKSVPAAKAVGELLASRCKDKSVETVVFDRNGFRYHGRIKALADGAREGGLKF